MEGLVLINVDPCAKGWIDWAASKVRFCFPTHVLSTAPNEQCVEQKIKKGQNTGYFPFLGKTVQFHFLSLLHSKSGYSMVSARGAWLGVIM